MRILKKKMHENRESCSSSSKKKVRNHEEDVDAEEVDRTEEAEFFSALTLDEYVTRLCDNNVSAINSSYGSTVSDNLWNFVCLLPCLESS